MNLLDFNCAIEKSQFSLALLINHLANHQYFLNTCHTLTNAKTAKNNNDQVGNDCPRKVQSIIAHSPEPLSTFSNTDFNGKVSTQ